MGQTFSAVELQKFILSTLSWGTGHQLITVTQGYVIYELTGSSFQLAILGGAVTLASVTMAVIGGFLADRMSRKTLMLLGSAVISTAMLAVSVLMLTDRVEAWHLQLAGAVQGATLAMDWTTRFSILPSMVGRRILARAISFDFTSFNLSRILGPLVWGWIVTAFGADWPYVLISALFAFNLLVISRFRPRTDFTESSHARTSPDEERGLDLPSDSTVPQHGRLWQEISEITDIVRGNPIVAGNLIFTAVNALLMGGLIYLLSPLAKEVFIIDAEGLGQLFTAIGLGAFIGGLVLGMAGGARRMGYALLGSNALAVSCVLLFSLSGSFYMALLLGLLFGLFNGMHIGLGTISLQVSVSDEIRGRLGGAYEVAWAAFPAGGFIFGAVAGWLGLTEALLIGSLLVGLVTIGMGVLNPSLRRFRYLG